MTLLNLNILKAEARRFVQQLNGEPIGALYGVTDGKAVGTYIERLFNNYLLEKYEYGTGSAASGIDFPELEVDVKTTSINQPQSSCPFVDASQKVYGLGYHLIVFVYDKRDDATEHAARLNFQHVIFVARERTGDYQTTFGLRQILERNGNRDDIVAFLEERNLPLDEIGRSQLAEKILHEPPIQGYLTVSNAMQWRLQYGRVITVAADGHVEGVETLLE